MGLPQFDPGLFFDAAKRPDRKLFLPMWDRYAAGYLVVLELDVAALVGDLPPTSSDQG
jgi:hypothetical protein